MICISKTEKHDFSMNVNRGFHATHSKIVLAFVIRIRLNLHLLNFPQMRVKGVMLLLRAAFVFQQTLSFKWGLGLNEMKRVFSLNHYVVINLDLWLLKKKKKKKEKKRKTWLTNKTKNQRLAEFDCHCHASWRVS